MTEERIAEIRKHEDYARRQVAHVVNDIVWERQYEREWTDLRDLLSYIDALQTVAQQLVDALDHAEYMAESDFAFALLFEDAIEAAAALGITPAPVVG